MRPVTRPPRTLAVAGVALLTTLTFAACSAGNGADSSTSADMDPAGSAAGGAGAGESSARDAPNADSISYGAGGSASDPALVPPAASIIRVGAVILEADEVGDVVAQVETLAASVGGEIANEETYTDTDGQQTRSRLTLKVPVDTFDESIDKIETFGDPISTTSDSEDVTAKVADVNSRVTSAQESITQLRRLFSQAQKLGDIITLERELALREADLEALQAQQRSLAARTTMSTITINISRPDESETSVDEDQAGFVAGVNSGWDAMVTFVIGAGHALGLALPLGSLALALCLIGWVVVRRINPRRAAPASE